MTDLQQTPDRFEHRPRKFVHVAHPTLIYCGLDDRAEFDRIAAPCDDLGENENGHVLVKTVEQRSGAATVSVIFQYWIKSLTTEAFIEQMKEKRAARAAAGGAP